MVDRHLALLLTVAGCRSGLTVTAAPSPSPVEALAQSQGVPSDEREALLADTESPAAQRFDLPPRTTALAFLSRELLGADGGVPQAERQIFPDEYAAGVDGVFTFRGGPRRTGGAYGTIPRGPHRLEVVWEFKTGESAAPWLGGAGWTGQPVIVRWPAVIRHSLAKLGRHRFRDDFVEVIQGSLDGNVYFLDLATGKKSRPPLVTKNPIKGSVSLDPRGYPLLFVGQGIPARAPIGLRLYDLISHRELFFLAGRDTAAPRRGWGAFDSSGLLNRATDTYVVGGENGLVYSLRLNTAFDPIEVTLRVRPEVARYRYRTGKGAVGVENSVAAIKNLAYFADNAGVLQAVDLRTFDPVWTFDAGDDTDATVTVDLEGGHPVLYTGCEVDRTGPFGRTYLRRLDGLTGELTWERSFECEGARGPPKKIDAGMFATNVVGGGDVSDLVFFTLSRCPGPQSGVVLALDKKTGTEVWSRALDGHSWSSPTALRDEDGKTWLLQADITGTVRLLDARTGAQAAQVKLEGEIEASPAAFQDRVVLGTRADRIYGLRIVGEPSPGAGTVDALAAGRPAH